MNSKKILIIGLIFLVLFGCSRRQTAQSSISSTNPPGVHSVDEVIQIFNRNRLREENNEYTVRGIFEKIHITSSYEIWVYLQRANNLNNLTEPFFVKFNWNNIPSDIYNIVPGDILTFKGRIGGMVGIWLENTTLINIEKKYDFRNLDEFTARQFFDRITSNPIWADGKTFRINGKIRSISEHQGRIIIRLDGAHMDDWIDIWEPLKTLDNVRRKCFT